jgi:hypothetical protein
LAPIPTSCAHALRVGLVAARRPSCYHHLTMPAMPPWTKDDVSRFLSHYGTWHGVDNVVPLAGGCDNLNLLVSLGERRVVLRR